MLVLILVLAVFSVLVLIHEAGHLFAAKKAGIHVEAFSLGMGKRLFGFNVGGTDYRISMLPFGGFCKMAGDDPVEAKGKEEEFLSKPVGYRFWVIAAGAITNYIFAFVLLWIIYMIGVPALSNQVGQVLKGYPAEDSGMEVGDRILAINGSKVEYWDDIVKTIKDETKNGDTLDIEIDRSGTDLVLNVRPEMSIVKNIFGQTIARPMIGIAPKSETLSISYGPVRAMYYGGRRLIELTGMTYKSIWLLLTGGMSVKTSVTGPIGIAQLIGQAAKVGLVPLLFIMANISMALAVFNLLPFPVLDGGHIIFLLFEKFRGRPVDLKVQEHISTVAIILLCTFVIFVSWQDILRTPLGEKITSITNKK